LLAPGLFSDPPHPRSVPPAPSPARRSPGSPPAPWFAIALEPCMDGSRGARAFWLMLAWFQLRPCIAGFRLRPWIRRLACSTGAARPGEGPRSPWSRSGARAPGAPVRTGCPRRHVRHVPSSRVARAVSVG
jgi:hypothetical protein